MKTKTQIESELKRIGSFTLGRVFTAQEFTEELAHGCITPYDGVGFYHDGEKQTGVSVWEKPLPNAYPYVIWFNR